MHRFRIEMRMNTMVRLVWSIVIDVAGMLERQWFDFNLSGGEMYFLGLVLILF
jgi:hypothetical protein